MYFGVKNYEMKNEKNAIFAPIFTLPTTSTRREEGGSVGFRGVKSIKNKCTEF